MIVGFALKSISSPSESHVKLRGKYTLYILHTNKLLKNKHIIVIVHPNIEIEQSVLKKKIL